VTLFFAIIPVPAATLPNEADRLVRGAAEFLAQRGPVWAWRLLAAIVLLTAGRWLVRLLLGVFERHLEKTRMDVTLRRFLCRSLQTLALVVLALAVLDIFGVQSTSLVAIIGAATVAVGLSLKDSLSNFASGVMLVTLRPFKVRDSIESGGVTGEVEEIGVFSTRLRTGDNRIVIVPNTNFVTQTVTNNTANGERRIDLVVGVSYDDDLQTAREIILGVLRADERVLHTPEPAVLVDALADSSVNLAIRAWVKTPHFAATKPALLEHIKVALETGGCSIPFPQRELKVTVAHTSADRPVHSALAPAGAAA